MSWLRRLFRPVDPYEVALELHDVILDLDADLYDSEHRHSREAKALAAYRDAWLEEPPE